MSSEVDPFLLDAANQIESDLIYFGELQDQTKDLWTFIGFDPEAYQHATTIIESNSTEYNRLLPIFLANLDARSILTTNPRNPEALVTIEQTEDALITSADLARAESILAANLDDLIQREASQNLSPTERAASNAFIQREKQARAIAQRKLDAYHRNPQIPAIVDALTTHFKFQEATHQLQIIESLLQLPITGNLNRLIENYKSANYTHDCLQVGHSDKFCWESAVKYGNTPTVQTIMDHRTTKWPTKSMIESAAKLAVANDNGELLDILLAADPGRLLFKIADDIVTLDRLNLLDMIWPRLEEAALGDDVNYDPASELAIRAIVEDQPRILEYIWNHASRDDLIDSLPFAAMTYGKPQYIQWLLQHAPEDAHVIYQRAFAGSVQSGNIDAVREYLPYSDIDDRSFALGLAIRDANYEIVDFLLNASHPNLQEVLVYSARMDLRVYNRLLDSTPTMHLDDRIDAVKNVVDPGDPPVDPELTYNRTEDLKVVALQRLLDDDVPITPDLVVSALKQGHVQVARFLIERNPDIAGASADMLIDSLENLRQLPGDPSTHYLEWSREIGASKLDLVMNGEYSADDIYHLEKDARLSHLHQLATGADYRAWAVRIGSNKLVDYLENS